MVWTKQQDHRPDAAAIHRCATAMAADGNRGLGHYVPPLVAFMIAPNASLVERRWIAGDLSLYGDRLRFDPSGERPDDTSAASVEIGLSDVVDVRWRPGLIAGAIEVTYGRPRATFRIRGSRPLAAVIRAAAEQSQSAQALQAGRPDLR
jgi:hypothetical protein